MKNLTAKDAVMTVTIQNKNGGDIESFFFYDYEDYSLLIKTITDLQLKTGGN